MIQEVRVAPQELPDTRGADTLREIRHLGISSVREVKTARVYRFEGIGHDEALSLADCLFAGELGYAYAVNAPMIADADRLLEVAYKPGVMNPEAASLCKVASDLGHRGLVTADSSWEYGFYGEISEEELALIRDRLLVNKTVERVVVEPPRTLVIGGEAASVEYLPIRERCDEELMELSRAYRLGFDRSEMQAIRDYFRREGREPTDVELEQIAALWSEHCSHKTFKADLVVDGIRKPSLMSRLKAVSREVARGVLSAFVDNAGVVEFYDGLALCGKVETHNSPSAIEPYGGAATGSGGVFRDIMGTGLGARVIASTDMFCFAPPDLPFADLPDGCLHPHYLLRRVVAGVRDYGNRMGIPTNNGSVHFHRDFRAKPTVIVGAYGVMPAECAQKGKPLPGDIVIAVGGRTGRDGIHGATFSSAAMTAHTITADSSAVQIGHAIEEKRMADALLACRDRGWIRAITDCGAGGFASAITEMGAETGVHVALDRAPLKYPGLSPREIWISESQERMVAAVPPEHAGKFVALCRDYNVEATVLGRFSKDGQLLVTYNGAVVCDLSMEFIHDGMPERILTATSAKHSLSAAALSEKPDWEKTYLAVMAHLNVCSKEPIVRMYDHSVQGTNALHPYGGVHHDAPNDAVVLRPVFDKPYGFIVGHGMNPILTRLDPYWGSVWAAAEAVSNIVAVGADPYRIWLIDNFIWPYPDAEELAALDAAVDACVDVMHAWHMPFISGKDSLSSTYVGTDGAVIKIPRVLCVSAMGKITDVGRTASSDFKRAGSAIVLVGWQHARALAGSVYAEVTGDAGQIGMGAISVPRVALHEVMAVWRAVHALVSSGRALAVHDVSEGGVAVALAEMCFGGDCGADVDVSTLSRDSARCAFFNETTGCFLVEMPEEDIRRLHAAAPELLGIPMTVIGRTKSERAVTLRGDGVRLAHIPLDTLKAAWQRPMQEVF